MIKRRNSSTTRRSPNRDTAAPTATGLPEGYARLHRQFGWRVPQRFNMAHWCCGRWAQAPDAKQRVAVRVYNVGSQGRPGSEVQHSYAHLQAQANRLSHVLAGHGVRRGDRVAIVMPQCFETAVAYIAVL